MLGRRGSVMVFLGGLPTNLTRKELKGFVLPAVRMANGRGLGLSLSVSGWTILRRTDRQTGAIEVHGLVEIRPGKAGMDVISQLHNREFRGRRITAHRYRARAAVRGECLADDIASADGIKERERRRSLAVDLVNG
jgi:hypothetical protein